MKILVVNGSPRKGNIYTCVNAFAEGANAVNEVEILYADGLNISPCKGCHACQCTNGCVAADDTNMAIDKIAAADLIVFASPIYWWGITAQLKTVIDKCYCRCSLLKGKKIGLILCAGEPTDNEEYDLIRRQFELISEYLSWDMVFFKKFFAVRDGDIANNPEAVAEMKVLGEEYC